MCTEGNETRGGERRRRRRRRKRKRWRRKDTKGKEWRAREEREGGTDTLVYFTTQAHGSVMPANDLSGNLSSPITP